LQLVARCAASRTPIFAAGLATRGWIKQGVEPGYRPWIELPASTHIANPCRKIGNRHQFFIQPGEIGYRFHAHHASQTFWAVIRQSLLWFILGGRFHLIRECPIEFRARHWQPLACSECPIQLAASILVSPFR
jgi:hypothetical protein